MRAPNCRVLGRFAWAVMVPKPELLAVVDGALNVGWFSRLNASARICRYARSPIPKRFSIDWSHWLMPSARRFGKVVENVRMWYWKASPDLVSNSEVLNAVALASRLLRCRDRKSTRL